LLAGPQRRVTLQLRPVFLGAARGVVFQHDARGAHGAAFHVEVFVHGAQPMAQRGSEQAMHWLPREAAPAQRMPEEVRTAQQQPDIRLLDLPGKQRAHLALRRCLQPFVCIQQQHPRFARHRDRCVFLQCETLPFHRLHACARGGGEPHGVVGRTRIEHDHFAAQRAHRSHAAFDAVGLVLRDDDAGQGQGRVLIDRGHARDYARGRRARLPACQRSHPTSAPSV
jgi:hypothetical protein